MSLEDGAQVWDRPFPGVRGWSHIAHGQAVALTVDANWHGHRSSLPVESTELMRLAITFSPEGPDLAKVAAVLGRERALNRLEHVLGG